MNLVIEAISVLMFIIILKTTDFSIRDIGLRISDVRATFVPDILITAGGVVFLVVGKIEATRAASDSSRPASHY